MKKGGVEAAGSTPVESAKLPGLGDIYSDELLELAFSAVGETGSDGQVITTQDVLASLNEGLEGFYKALGKI